jgi:hypothetical protein
LVLEENAIYIFWIQMGKNNTKELTMIKIIWFSAGFIAAEIIFGVTVYVTSVYS